MKWCQFVSVMAALVLAFATTAQAEIIVHGGTTINMDFVNVGNAGNMADSETGRGSVGSNYRIGKYEVTADQWAAVIAADSNVGNAGNWSGSQPTAGTSWYEAAKFCNWLTTGSAATGVYSFSGPIADPSGVVIDRSYRNAGGGAYFIPTENEWYKAAYFDPNKGGAGVSGYWDYPTKHDSPNVPDGIDFAGDTDFDAVFKQNYNQGHPNSVDNSGVLSAYGTKGQGGNAFEWNETEGTSSSRGVRGGYWNIAIGSDGLLASNPGVNVAPSLEYASFGFRVASLESVPEPSTLALWSMIGIAGVGYRWCRKRRMV